MAGESAAEPTAAAAIPADDPDVRSAIHMLEEWLRYRIEWVGPPGLSIAVTYHGDMVWAAGFGFADVERRVPATPTSVFRGASLTKPITAIAILQLRDAGRLSLEDSVSRYLPWFAEAERAGGRQRGPARADPGPTQPLGRDRQRRPRVALERLPFSG